MATGNNTIDVFRKKKKFIISKFTYFNYEKKGYYANTFLIL